MGKPRIKFMFLVFKWCVFGDINENIGYHRHFNLFEYRKAKSELTRILKETKQSPTS